MKPEQAEQFLIEQLYHSSKESEVLGPINKIDKLTGDASTRRYYRIFTERDSYVVCLDHPLEDSSDNTFTLFQDFFYNNGIRVPKIMTKELNKGYLLEEDLGDTTLLTRLSQISSHKQEFELYKDSLDLMIKIHQCPKDESLIQLKFDQDKLNEEIDFTIKYYLRNLLGEQREDLIKDVRSLFYEVNLKISQFPMVVTHRDYHSRNLMIKDDCLVVIDFQDTRLGIPQYDLVSLLEDCYYDLKESNREKLIKYYWDNMDLSQYGQNDFEDFMTLYHYTAIQRVFKAIGSFSYIHETRKDIRYLKHISFAMEKIKQFLFKYDSLIKLKKSLFQIYYEN